MKIFLRYLTFIFIAITQLSAQEGWEWLNPRPQGFELGEAYTINPLTGLIFGEQGVILKTKDGGITWEFIQIEENSNRDIHSVLFLDKETGFAVQGNTLLKTTDGGDFWQRHGEIPDPWITDIYFINEEVGWASCYWWATYRTTDGGSSWEMGALDDLQDFKAVVLHSIYFIDENTGWAAGDGKKTWTNGVQSRTIHSGLLFNSTDGGKTWNIKFATYPERNWFVGITFLDDKIGYAEGHPDFYSNFKTIDGGERWFLTSEDFPIKIDNVGWKVEGDNILRTENGGSSWQSQTEYITRENLNSVFFLDENRGYVVGDNGVILRTVNGGETWTIKIHESVTNFKSIQLTDPETGWILGSDDGMILKTNDGGDSWAIQMHEPSIILNDFFFINADLGWVVGTMGDSLGTVLKTSDGGDNWTSDIIKGVDKLCAIHFIDSDIGWAVGKRTVWCGREYCEERGYIIKTKDGGKNWIIQDSVDWIPNDIFFLDENIGWIGVYGGILKTLNSGENWEYSEIGDYGAGFVTDICFIDKNMGHCLDENYIYSTSNGGLSWEESDRCFRARSLCFLNQELGYIVGERGRILKNTHNRYWVNIKTPDKMSNPIGFKLFQNYPNPFNPLTYIKITLPASENVIIKVYNLLGEEITTVVNSKLSAGIHTYEFDGSNFASGVYLYRIEAGKWIDVKKMLLIK